MAYLALIMTLFTHLAWAEYSEQPAKEPTSDLRSQTVLFSIEGMTDKKIYLLERSSGDDYFLRLRRGKEETIKKVAGREALHLDREFASKFLKSQYELPSKEGSCEIVYKLSMKGELMDICQKDDQKTQEFKPILENLSKRF